MNQKYPWSHLGSFEFADRREEIEITLYRTYEALTARWVMEGVITEDKRREALEAWTSGDFGDVTDSKIFATVIED